MTQRRQLGATSALEIACLATLSLLPVLAGCGSSEPSQLPQTAPRISNAEDARRRLDQLEQRGECLELQSAFLSMKSMPVALSSTPSKEGIEEFRDAVEDLRSKMPDALKADYDVIAKAYEELLSHLDGLDLSDPAKVPQNASKARDSLRLLDDAPVKIAQQHLDAYFETCRVTPG